MASRQEEKERRRRERLEREAAERRAAARRTRLQWVAGGLLAVALVAGLVVALVAGVGGGEGDASEPSSADLPRLPSQRFTNLAEAADAAGCEVTNPRYEGAGHQTRDFRPGDYRTNPPTSGPHEPQWYDDGIYEPGTVPRLGMLVHTLEHGRINVQYRPGTPDATVRQLQALLAEADQGYHMLLYENTTDMPYAVAATAWTHALTCKQMNDRVFDAMRAFRARYIDKGPEQVP